MAIFAPLYLVDNQSITPRLSISHPEVFTCSLDLFQRERFPLPRQGRAQPHRALSWAGTGDRMSVIRTENLNQRGDQPMLMSTLFSRLRTQPTTTRDDRSEEFAGFSRTLSAEECAEIASATADLNAAMAMYEIRGITHCRHHVSDTESVADVVAAVRAQTELAHLFGARRARQRADGELPPLSDHMD